MGLDQISVFTPPPSPSSTSLTPPNLLLPFHDDRKPSGAWRTPSQLTLSRGNFFFLSNMWKLWFKCTSKELWSFPRLPFLSQIKTMTVESVNRQMYDNHFPQAHYCGAHGRRTGFIIMPQPLLQLSRFSPILSLLQRWGIFMRLLGQVSHVDIRHASTW